jgi:hypothetical protein
MRVIKIILVIFFILILLGAIGGFIFLKTFDISRYRPQITAAATAALGRPVDFKDLELDVSLQNGIHAGIRDLTVGEHPAFGPGNFLEVEEVLLGIDVLAYLFRKNIAVTRLQIVAPRITLVREKDGQFNVQTFGREGPEASAPGTAALPAVLISALNVTGGTLTYIDRGLERDFNLAISRLDFAINGFSLTGPFHFELAGALLNPQQNIQINGRARLDLKSGGIKFNDIKLTTDFSKFDPLRLRELAAAFGPAPFPEALEGGLTVLVKHLSAGSNGLDHLEADIRLSEGKAVFSEIAPGINLAVTQLNAGVTGFSLGAPFNFQASAAWLDDRPNLELAGKAAVNPDTRQMRLETTVLNLDLSSVSLEQLKTSITALKNTQLPESLSGKLKLTLHEFLAGPGGIESFRADASLTEAAVAAVNIGPGINLNVQKMDLSLKDVTPDPAVPFEFTARAAYLDDQTNLSLKGLATLDPARQTLHVLNAETSVDLDRISLKLLREQIPALRDVPLPEALAGTLRATITAAEAGPQGLNALRLDAAFHDSRVTINEAAPGVNLDINKISMDVKDFSLTGKPFAFTLKAAYLHPEPNFQVSGSAVFDPQTRGVRLADTSFTTDLALVSLDQLRSSMTALKDAPLPAAMKGEIKVTVEELTAGSDGLKMFKARAGWSNGSMTLNGLPVPATNIEASARITETLITVDNLGFNLGEGRIDASGTIQDYRDRQAFTINAEVKDLEPGALVDQKNFPNKLEGKIFSTFTGGGQGFDPAVALNRITASGDARLEDGKLTDINILRMVLDKISIIPNLRPELEAGLPPRFKETLKQKDTVLNAVEFKPSIKNGAVYLDQAGIDADGFVFTGKGKAGFDRSYTVEGVFLIPADLAESMAVAVPETRYLFDDSGRISFPLKVSGLGGKINFLPDVKSVGTNILRNTGKEALLRAIGIEPASRSPAPEGEGGRAEENTPGQETPPSAGEPDTRTKPVEQILIEGVLDSIFGR